MSYFFLDGGGGWRYIIPLIKEEDTVIGSNDSINNYFNTFTKCNTIKLRSKPTLYPNIILNIILFFIDYYTHFRKLKNEDIYYFGRVSAITFFSHLNRLSKNNKIHLLAPKDRGDPRKWYFEQNIFVPRYNFLLNAIKRILKVDAGVKLKLDKPMWYLKENTISSYDFVFYDRTEPVVSFPKKYKSLLKKKKTLLLLNNLPRVMNNPLESSNIVASLLDKEHTIIKNHTRNPEILGDLSKYDQFPPFIPAEILISNHDWDYIISVYISKTFLTNSKPIKVSLYNLFNWKHPVPDTWIKRNRIIENGVRLPKTKEEFKEIYYE